MPDIEERRRVSPCARRRPSPTTSPRTLRLTLPRAAAPAGQMLSGQRYRRYATAARRGGEDPAPRGSAGSSNALRHRRTTTISTWTLVSQNDQRPEGHSGRSRVSLTSSLRFCGCLHIDVKAASVPSWQLQDETVMVVERTQLSSCGCRPYKAPARHTTDQGQAPP